MGQTSLFQRGLCGSLYLTAQAVLTDPAVGKSPRQADSRWEATLRVDTFCHPPKAYMVTRIQFAGFSSDTRPATGIGASVALAARLQSFRSRANEIKTASRQISQDPKRDVQKKCVA